jgi:hypothetical protein
VLFCFCLQGATLRRCAGTLSSHRKLTATTRPCRSTKCVSITDLNWLCQDRLRTASFGRDTAIDSLRNVFFVCFTTWLAVGSDCLLPVRLLQRACHRMGEIVQAGRPTGAVSSTGTLFLSVNFLMKYDHLPRQARDERQRTTEAKRRFVHIVCARDAAGRDFHLLAARPSTHAVCSGCALRWIL